MDVKFIKPNIQVGNISPGECFKWNNVLYMKVALPLVSSELIQTTDSCYIVQLSSGVVNPLHPSVLVLPVTLEAVAKVRGHESRA